MRETHDAGSHMKPCNCIWYGTVAGNWEKSKDHDTAAKRPWYAHYTLDVRLHHSQNTATIGPRYAHNTPTIRPIYGSKTARVRPIYGHYTAAVYYFKFNSVSKRRDGNENPQNLYRTTILTQWKWSSKPCILCEALLPSRRVCWTTLHWLEFQDLKRYMFLY